ncbi:MAG: DUF4199 domain-containing protein [Breznakibacter sp.]
MVEKAMLLFKAAMRYGLYLGPLLILSHVLLYVFIDLEKHSLMGIMGWMFLFSFLPFVIGIYWLMKRFRNEDFGGFMRYWEGVRFGTTLMLFAGIITAGYQLVFNSWVDPAYAPRVQEVIAEKTVAFYEKTGVPQSQIDAFIKEYDKSTAEAAKQSQLTTSLMSIPMSAFMGFLVSLVIATILRRRGDPFESAMRNIE